MSTTDKKTVLAVAIAASITSMSAVPTALADGVSLIPGVGYYSFDNDLNLDDTTAPSIGLQYLFGNNFAIEANYSESEVDFENSTNDFDWKHTRIDAFYNFTGLNDKMVPYLVAGAGEAVNELDDGSKEDETLLNAGAGVKFLLDRGFSIIADLRAVNSIDQEKTSGLASLAFSYTMDLGTKKSTEGDFDLGQTEEKPTVQDADQDGIADANDSCLTTPIGVAIDDSGCALDGDNDGIADYRDECAQTPADASVDGLGCPVDSDGDGIADYQDKCPSSAASTLIDEVGCELKVSENISFPLNSASLETNALPKVEEIATFLKRYQDTIAIIEGHSDASGEAAYNEKLSELRAAQVKQILVDQFNINPDRLRTESYGESRPIANNDTREGRQENRRVTAKIVAQ
jgi:OOP family OmpA-OmpF porin